MTDLEVGNIHRGREATPDSWSVMLLPSQQEGSGFQG